MIPLARPDLQGNELKYVTEAIETGWLTHAGRFEKAFEEAFSQKFGVPALATSSGTGALHLALLALGIGPGDEVIVPDLTFGATASVVLAVGARPVVGDIDPITWGLDKNRVMGLITKRTKALMPVHLYGEDAGDFREFGIPVVEDACESLGMVPVRGDIACYSFYGNKPLTTGEGGMICGDFGDAAKWRDGGFDEHYSHNVPGLNYRMTNLQAAIGLAQLERFDEMLAPRLRNASIYAKLLKGRGKWLFVAEVEDVAATRKRLLEAGVDTRPVFTPLHRCQAYAQYAGGDYPVSDEIWRKGVALPTGPHLSGEQATVVAGLVKASQQEERHGHHNECRAGNRSQELARAL